MENKLKTIIFEALTDLDDNLNNEEIKDKIIFEKPKQKIHGDLSSNIALQLSKHFKMAPRKIAENLISKIEKPENIEKIEIAGPGFINFYIKEEVISKKIIDILKENENYGRNNRGNGEKVNIEFSSVNPTGPISVGHGRQAVLGDVIARIMEFSGYNVTKEYYCNDTGNQIKKLGESIISILNDEPIPENGYNGNYVKDIAKEWKESVDNIPEDRDRAIAVAGNYAKEILKNNIIEDCKALNVIHDVVYSEKSLHDRGEVKKTLNFLIEKDLAYEKEGAWWLRATKFGDEKDRVLVKSDGNTTYALNDAAYHKTKIDRGFEKIIDIFGADHHGYIPRLTALVKSLGFNTDNFHILIHQFVTLLKNGKVVRMSKRAATFVTLRELLEEVGSDVIRYYFLERKMEAQVEFDIEVAKKESMDNPVYYLQYCHARSSSILREAEKQGYDISIENLLKEENIDKISLLNDEKEIDIIKKCVEFPKIVERAVENYTPHIIIHYAQEVAKLFQSYYTAGKRDERFRVIVENRDETISRLILTLAVKIIIKNILNLLGMNAPERM